MSTDASYSPCLRDAITNLLDSMLNVGILRYLLGDFKSKIGQRAPIGCSTVNIIFWTCLLGVLAQILSGTRDGLGHSVNLTFLGQFLVDLRKENGEE